MTGLFDRYQLKGLELKNRVMMSPMCMYSVEKEDGVPNEWHYVHYTSRAIAGTGLIMLEAASVEPNGRISYQDLGIWDDGQISAYQRLVEASHTYGAKVGIQLAHAGRKAGLERDDVVGPTDERFSERLPQPRALTTDEVQGLVESFARAANRAVQAGFDTMELHGAHGYLLHQFMSPKLNRRDDRYGDPLAFPLEVIQAVKSVIPTDMPLLFRVSAVEYGEGGYGIDTIVEYCRALKKAGVDMIDVSSGGDAPVGPAQVYPGYQVPYAARIRQGADIPVIAVGMLENPGLAQHVVQTGAADVIAIARGMLRDPHWTNSAAVALGAELTVPKQYARAF